MDSGRELETPWRLAERRAALSGRPLLPRAARALPGRRRRSGGRTVAPARIALAAAVALASLEALRRVAGRLLAAGPRVPRPARSSSPVASSSGPAAATSSPSASTRRSPSPAIAWAHAGRVRARRARRATGAAAACLLAALLSRPEMGLAAIAALALERRRARRLDAAGVVPCSRPRSSSTPSSRPARRSRPCAARAGSRSSARRRRSETSTRPTPGSTGRRCVWPSSPSPRSCCCSSPRCSPRPRPLAARRGAAGAALEVAAVAILAVVAAVCLAPPDRLAPTLSLFPPLVRVVPPLVVAAGVRLTRARCRTRSRRVCSRRCRTRSSSSAALFAARLLLAAGYVGPYSAFFLPLAARARRRRPRTAWPTALRRSSERGCRASSTAALAVFARVPRGRPRADLPPRRLGAGRDAGRPPLADRAGRVHDPRGAAGSRGALPGGR